MFFARTLGARTDTAADHFDDDLCGAQIPEHFGYNASCRVKHRRLITVLVYLDTVDPANGGATYFVDRDVRVPPVAGSAIVFFPTLLDGRLVRGLCNAHFDTSPCATPPLRRWGWWYIVKHFTLCGEGIYVL